jgi:hypothetical protein
MVHIHPSSTASLWARTRSAIATSKRSAAT